MLEIAIGSVVGLVVGIRHAFDPDHLAAVSTIASDTSSAKRSALVGAFWGLGHCVTLLTLISILAVADTRLPPIVSELFELAVALVLIGLGLRSLRSAAERGSRGNLRLHWHRRGPHEHACTDPHIHLGSWTLARRPLVVGMIHGLAGSGSLAALTFAALPTTEARIGYVALFALGSALAMTALSGVAGIPLKWIANRRAATRWLGATVGLLSTTVGIVWGIPVVVGWIG